MAWGEYKEEDFEETEERKIEEKVEEKKNEEREKELEDIGFDLSTHSDSEKKYFSEQLNSSEDVFEKENEEDKTYRKPSEKVFIEDKIKRGEASFKEKFWCWVSRNKSISDYSQSEAETFIKFRDPKYEKEPEKSKFRIVNVVRRIGKDKYDFYHNENVNPYLRQFIYALEKLFLLVVIFGIFVGLITLVGSCFGLEWVSVDNTEGLDFTIEEGFDF